MHEDITETNCNFISFWYGTFTWIWCVFNLNVFNDKTVLTFFEKSFRFLENLFQSQSIENVQIFHWLTHRNMLISSSEDYFENTFFRNPYLKNRFLEETMLFMLALKWTLWDKAFSDVDKNQPKFCRKTCWKEQPFNFTVYFMNNIFQISVLVNT